MLVLSRKLGEKIMIGENIVVTVVKIDRNQIRIGIEAPVEVPVYREEIDPNAAHRVQPEANAAAEGASRPPLSARSNRRSAAPTPVTV